MAQDWDFDPLKERAIFTFEEFEQLEWVKQTIADIDSTPLGNRLLEFVRYIDPLVAFDDEMPLYSLYVPYEHNLEAPRTNGEQVYDEGAPLMLLDPNSTDRSFFPYLLAHQLFRCAQDLLDDDESLLLPMFQNSVVYNPMISIVDKREFVQAYKAMERACDVVALTVLHQMTRTSSNKSAFGVMSQQKHTADICQWIAQTSAFVEGTGIGRQNEAMAHDLVLYMGNMGGAQSTQYNEDIERAAEKAYANTVNNPGFADLDVQTEDASSPFNSYHLSLISDTYADRSWDVNGWIEAVNKYLAEEKKDRAFRISEAFKMAAEARKEDEIERYLNGEDITPPAANDDKPQTPKEPKAQKPKGHKPPKPK